MVSGNSGRDASRSQSEINIRSLDIAGVVAKITKIPDNMRSFVVSAEGAAAEFRVSLELQDELLAAGMPSAQHGGIRCFDSTDLLNISLHLDIGSRQRKVLNWWARELGRPYGESVTYRVDYLTGCPDLNHPGLCTFSLLDPGSRRIEYTSDDRAFRTHYSHIFTLPRKWPPLPHVAREIIDETREIRFMRFPHALRWDVSFIRREKVADCSGIAEILVSEAISRGIPARLSYGVALTPPFASPHFWAEFLIDGIWVPVDPVFIDALLEWGILNKDRWNRYKSIGSILARIASDNKNPIVLHNGEQGNVRFRVCTVNEPK